MQAALDEIYRVLKPNGRVIVMLYHKHSFNYYVRIMTYMRLRALGSILLRAGRWRTDRETARFQPLVGLRGNESRKIWEIHYHNFLKNGWRYLRADNFVHHCTDGPECPQAAAYSRSEARKYFARFHDVQMKVAHFPLNKYRLGRWIPFRVEKILAARLGWYLFIFATR
jgi:SAM-dependent methyltransferase